MKNYLLILFFALTVTAIQSGIVMENAGQVRLTYAEGHAAAMPTLAVNSGQTLKFSVASPLFPLTVSSLNFVQQAGDISVRLNPQITVVPSFQNSNVYHITIEAPEVKNITRAALHFYQKDENSTNVKLGTLSVIIYPPEDQTATDNAINQKMQENHTRILIVSGGYKRLENFFSQHRVDFEITDSIPTSLPRGTLCIAETFSDTLKKLPPPNAKARYLFFICDVFFADPPGIYTTLTASGGAVTKVTLPILSDLETNPRSREIFLNLINQHLSRDMAVEN